ncbi:sulfotransferase [Candidatus Kaiserbacteria bacterium]|nr:sulfotransferase [Candidatus Kaiserbacteria bacterium]
MAILSPKEKLQRLYNDLVLGRSRVRIVPATTNWSAQETPIFIIGLPRSGTTLLRYVVDSHSRICCPPESNFIGELEALLASQDSRNGLESMGFSEDHVIARLREFSLYFWSNYALSKGKPRWADKSTSYIRHTNFLYKLYPEAQYLIIYRHGMDQVHSLTNGGKVVPKQLEPYLVNGEDVRIAGARHWVEWTQQLLAFEAQQPNQCFSLRYEDLCEFPEIKLKQVFCFLDEIWEPTILQFNEFDHDKGPEHGRTSVTNNFTISRGRWHSWPTDITDYCLDIMAPTLQKLNYMHSSPQAD